MGNNWRSLSLAFVGSWLLIAADSFAKGFPEFPTPDSARLTIVADEMVVGGVRMRAVQFDVPMSMEELTDFYDDTWNKRVAVTEFDPWTILAHRIGDYLLTVQAQTAGADRVVGVLGITDAFDENAKPYVQNFKMPPGSEIINDIEATDLGKKSRTVVFKNSSNLDTNINFFRRSYKRKGFTEVVPNERIRDAERSALIMNGSGRQLDVTFSRRDGATFVVAVLVDL